MLKRISIENYALIEKSEIEFENGFSVITGETGAGKSIILGALGLLVGQRTDSKALKDPERKCVVEAVFDISSLDLKSIFDEEDFDYDDECIIRREILPGGKSRSFVNDTPASVSALKSLGERLVDIHSQHNNLLLGNSQFQLSAVDAVAANARMLAGYSELYAIYEKNRRNLQKMLEALEKQNADRDYIEFQFNQLEAANLVDGEQADLEAEADRLTHSNDIQEALSKATWLLNEGDEAINNSLKECTNALRSVASFLPSAGELASRLESCMIETRDITRELDAMASDVETDPARLEMVNGRLDTIYSLEKKHNVQSVSQLVSLRDEYAQKLQSIEFGGEDILNLQREIEVQETELKEMARQLTEKRLSAKDKFESQIDELLHQMGMPNARFTISFGVLPALSPYGLDKVEFLFSANKEQSPRLLSDVASGGELSRVMLSLKYLLSQSVNLPTIILDEIDTGVSGEIADRMGNIMLKMGNKMQVISITHLPQIASKGETHYKVFKSDDERGTTSHIVRIEGEPRVQEIAKMLSGDTVSEAAVNNARELLS